MSTNDKIKMTKEEFETLYEITEDDPLNEPMKYDEGEKKPEPEFLTEEEEAQDSALFEDLGPMEDTD